MNLTRTMKDLENVYSEKMSFPPKGTFELAKGAKEKKKAFISKQSIYYVARTINDSIETYDTILKNCSSVSDYFKLIPLRPKTPNNNENSVKQNGKNYISRYLLIFFHFLISSGYIIYYI